MTGVHLLRRRLGADRGLLASLALLVLVTVLLGALGLRWWAERSDEALRQTAARVPPVQTGLTTKLDTRPDAVVPREDLDALAVGFDRVATAPLRDVVGPATWSAQRTRVEFRGIRGNYVDAPHRPDVRALSGLAEHVEVVEGRLPGPGTVGGPDRPTVVEGVLTPSAAEVLGLQPGDVVPLQVPEAAPGGEGEALPPALGGPSVVVTPGGGAVTAPTLGPVDLAVTGIVEPVDPEGGFWSAYGFGLDGSYEGLGGNSAPVLRGTVLLGPESYAALAGTRLGTELSLTWFKPLRPDELRIDEVAALGESVTEFRVDAARLGLGPAALRAVQPTTQLGEVLARYTEERRAVLAVLAVAVSGLAAVVVLVLALLLGLARGSWEAGAALARARGSSARQQGLLAAAAAGVVVVPAAAAGLVVAAALRPAPVGAGPLVLAGVVALGAIVGAAVVAARAGRGSGGARTTEEERPSPRRLVLEGLAVALSVGALLLARRRGAGEADARVDPLLASVPWLLALVASLAAAHLAAPLLRRLSRRLAGRRGAVAFLATARASRTGAAARLVGFAVVTTLATTLFTATVSSAVARGQATAAWTATQGDLRLDRARATERQVRLVSEVPGVRAVSALAVETGVTLRYGVQQANAIVIGLDPATWADVAAGSPLRSYAELADYDGSGPVPAVVSDRAAELIGDLPTRVTVPTGALDEVVVAGRVDDVPFDATAGGVALVVPLAALQALGPAYDTADTLLLRLDDPDGPGVEETVAGVQEALGTPAFETVRTTELAELRQAPFSTLLRRAYALVSVVTAAYALLAVLLWLVVTANARAAFLAVLRTLGTTRRQSGRLVLVELLPTVALAVLTGAATGWALTWVAAPTLDLTGLTRGAPTPLRSDPATMAFVVGVAVAVLVLAVAGSLAHLRRRRSVDVLRLGGER